MDKVINSAEEKYFGAWRNQIHNHEFYLTFYDRKEEHEM